MYCPNCRTPMHSNGQENVCPNCGTKINNQQMYGNQQQYGPYGPQQSPQQYGPRPDDHPSFGYGCLGYFIPIVGLILYLVWKNDYPLKAKSAGKGALISVIVNVVVSIIMFIVAFAAGLLATAAA